MTDVIELQRQRILFLEEKLTETTILNTNMIGTIDRLSSVLDYFTDGDFRMFAKQNPRLSIEQLIIKYLEMER